MKQLKSIRELASDIAKREGKKSEARIGDVREILAILCDIIFEQPENINNLLLMAGLARSKRSLKKDRAKKK